MNEEARTLVDADEAEALVGRLAREIDEGVPPEAGLILVGIQRRGDLLARRIAAELESSRGPIPTGSLDITLYRDDFAQVGSLPVIGTTNLPASIAGRHVVIVDDVLYTGRTIRAALAELADFGRASRVQLCVLIDRGGRELPIQADYVGRKVDVPPGMEVRVRVPDLDSEFGVELVAKAEAAVRVESDEPAA